MMNFGQAIEALKNGKKVARVGWNGKGMFLYYVPVGAYAPCTEIAANVVPWLANQTDMLSEDWNLIE